MDKITTPTGTVHAFDRIENKTWCGKTMPGRTGATIPSGITCGSCKRIMRKSGWTV